MIESHIGRLNILIGMNPFELSQENKKKLVTDLEFCIGWFSGLSSPDQDQKKQAARWYHYRGMVFAGNNIGISANDYYKLLQP